MKAKVRESKDPPFRGVDESPDKRPGVPREAPPHPLPGAHWATPEPQAGPPVILGQRNRPTPVFSTALPPKGLSGALRRAAYRIRDHKVRHWMLLLLADRVDTIEHRFTFRKRLAG